QAEDGIGYWSVTGVQTCALPISEPKPGGSSAGSHLFAGPAPRVNAGGSISAGSSVATSPGISATPASGSGASARSLSKVSPAQRSEERRVGKEGGTCGARYEQRD